MIMMPKNHVLEEITSVSRVEIFPYKNAATGVPDLLEPFAPSWRALLYESHSFAADYSRPRIPVDFR
jgi:hypothetical protein